MSDQRVFTLPRFEKRPWAPEPPQPLPQRADAYLHTPVANQNGSFPHTPYVQGPHTPGFHSPGSGSFHTPAFSNVQLTPALAGAFAPNGLDLLEGREIHYSPGEFDMSGGLNIAFDSFNEQGSVDTIPEEELPRMPYFQGPYPDYRLPSGQNQASVKTDHSTEYAPPNYVKQENCLPSFSPISHQGFPLHHTSPFNQKELQSSNEPITIEDLLKDEPFADLEKPSLSCIDDGDDDLLSLFFDFDDDTPTKKTPPSTKHRSSKSATTPTKPPRHKIPTFSAVASDNSNSKHVRKCKSFSTALKFSSNNTAGPAFSLEECFNEFHVTEGNYSFQDETARLSMQLGPGLAPKKNNRTEQTRPVLKKSKTTSNLCLPRLVCRNPKVLNNMELGLVLFQVNLKNSK